MKTWGVGLAVLLAAACGADMRGQEDGFRGRMQAGCATEDACLQLREEAHARLQNCQPNTIGVVRCDAARANLRPVR